MSAQSPPERFRLAGRYDGDRIVVFFEKVQFNGTMLRVARKIRPPVADGFFSPDQLPPSYLARFLAGPKLEHFKIGDRYDVLTGTSMLVVRPTSLVGCETDEEVGNDSYVGALGTVEGRDALYATKDYYVVRRRQEPERGKPGARTPVGRAGLSEQPVRIDTQNRIAEQLTSRMKTEATEAERRLAETVPRR